VLVVLAVAAVLGFREWTARQTLAAQARDLSGLRNQVETLTQTNAHWRAATEQAAEALSRTEKERQRAQEEAARLQAELQRLAEENRLATENRRKLEDEMREALQSRDVTISELAGKLTVSILDRVLFASGEAEIKAEGQEVLRKVAGVLKQFPDRQIQVIGHTDNVPIRTARFPSNWELSTARAMAAVRFLTEQAGVDAGRLGAVGQGEFHPVADNGTAEGRAKNRRIAIVVLPELFKANPELPAPEPAPAPPAAPDSAAK
jgi:chemotaxis protein MotB